jgi:hypothetical protein
MMKVNDSPKSAGNIFILNGSDIHLGRVMAMQINFNQRSLK